MENPFNNSSYHYIFKDNGEEHVTHSEGDNIEIMINDKADEVIEEFFSITTFQISYWAGNINKT